MITLITNDKAKVKCPAGWHEVTVDAAQKIAQWTGDKIEVFNILTGTNYAKVKADTSLGSTFFDAINFVYFPSPVANAPLPKVLQIDRGHIIEIPKKIGGLTIGQSIAVRERLEQVEARITKSIETSPNKFCFTANFIYDEAISFAVAVYLQPFYDKSDFDLDRAKNLEQFILQMPITEVYPVGFFLLSKQLKRGNGFIQALQVRLWDLKERFVGKRVKGRKLKS